MLTQKKIIAAAERAGWNCKITNKGRQGYEMTVQRYTNAGQDSNFEWQVPNLEYIDNAVYETYSAFDPSEQARLWTDDSGHGKNGAPYELADILEDMQEVEQFLRELWKEIANTH